VTVAYLVSDFPTLSETFIANEIHRLRQLGFALSVYSFSRPPAADVDRLEDVSRRLLPDVEYIGAAEAVWAAMTSPLAVLRAWRENSKLTQQSTLKANPLLRLLRAAAVARRMRQTGIDHLHAHWPYASQIAHLVRAMTGNTYSVSIHAHEVAHDGGHFQIIFPALAFAAFCNRGAMHYLLPQLALEARQRAHLVHHGVDLEGFAPLPMPAARAPLSIVSAGRLTRTKGFDRLIRACSMASRQGIELRLTILGRGALEEELKALSAELGMKDLLSLPGWVSQEELRTHLGAAHIFALLADTSFHDGLPNVVLEAMACARSVVLSPLPAVSEAVTDGVEGFVLKHAADVDGFVAALRRYQREPELLKTMGAAARRRVETDHDAARQIEKMADLLRSQAA